MIRFAIMRMYFSDVIEKNRARCKNRCLFVIRSLTLLNIYSNLL